MEEMFDKKEAANRLGMSVPWIVKKIQERKIKHIRIGGKIRFTQEILDEYIKDGIVEVEK